MTELQSTRMSVTDRPVSKGRRIPVHQIIGMMANGDTIEDLLKEYPSLQREDILACLNYAESRE